MKKIIRKVMLASVLGLASMPVFANEAVVGNGEKTFMVMGYFIGLGLAVCGGGIGQGNAVAAALEGIARNPSATDKIQVRMILGLALIESLVIFALMSIFMVKAAG